MAAKRDLREVEREYPDVGQFVEWLREKWKMEGEEVVIARAPGRLDVMGGISDYSGGLVLQMPIDRACFAAVQVRPGLTSIHITSRRFTGLESTWECPLETLRNHWSYESCRELFAGEDWVGYVVGALVVLKNEGYLKSDLPGMEMLLMSAVPEGKGVSSSACVEVASMKALVAALELDIDDFHLAALCQKVENRVVGASCGIMDQMTAMMGQKGKLMKLLCQPCTLLGHVPLPTDLAVIGIDSGERHSIMGSDYTSVRIGTFMGLKILSSRPELTQKFAYLTDLTPLELEQLGHVLPESIQGRAFLHAYGEHVDDATQIDPDKTYKVKSPTEHPTAEIGRVCEFCALLDCSDRNRGTRLGALMHGSHEAYQRLGLDSPWTNVLYEMTHGAVERGIYGGKISGGGSGGTVCVLVSRERQSEAVRHICTQFMTLKALDEAPLVFTGSSNGAHAFGILKHGAKI